jgi:ubiquinone/menaquinone biosynthesis C-methylase UbiE
VTDGAELCPSPPVGIPRRFDADMVNPNHSPAPPDGEEHARRVNAAHFDTVWHGGSRLKERLQFNLEAARKSFLHAMRQAGVPMAGVRVLDVGFGSGMLLFLFERSCAIAGTELSSAAIERARARAAAAGYARFEFVQSEGLRLPFPDESFDVVIASHVIEHVFDDLALLRELHRVARPQGHVVIVAPLDARTDGILDEQQLLNPAHRAAGHFHVRNYNLPSLVQRVAAAGGEVRYSGSELETWDWKSSLDSARGRLARTLPGRMADRVIAAALNVPLALMPWTLLRALDNALARRGYKPRQAAVVAQRIVRATGAVSE